MSNYLLLGFFPKVIENYLADLPCIICKKKSMHTEPNRSDCGGTHDVDLGDYSVWAYCADCDYLVDVEYNKKSGVPILTAQKISFYYDDCEYTIRKYLTLNKLEIDIVKDEIYPGSYTNHSFPFNLIDFNNIDYKKYVEDIKSSLIFQ